MAYSEAITKKEVPRPGNKGMLADIQRKWQVYLMLTPNVILFTVFSLYPVVWVLRYMFFEFNGHTAAKFIGMENYIRIFTRDTDFWTSVINTFVYAGGKLILTIPFSFLLALILSKSFRGSGVIKAVIFSPTIMSSAVMAMIFYLLFNVYNGDVNRYLLALKVINQPVNWLGKDMAMVTVIIVAVWGAIGNYMVYFLAGLNSISPEIYESAKLDGVNAIQEIFYITIPMLGPILKVIMMLAITGAFHDMQSIMVLTEGGPYDRTMVMFMYLYKMFFPISASEQAVMPQFGYGSALSVVCALIVGLVTIVYLRLSKKLDEIY